jgi:hypothetical protein
MAQPIAILSVYDKAGLLPFAEGLQAAGVRLLGSGGTAKAIRNANMKIECVQRPLLLTHLSVQQQRNQREWETRTGCGEVEEKEREMVQRR